jgi:ABC-type branched-subunit amino acid transport system permease subunit
MLHDGVPWGLAVLIGGLIALPVGAIVAIPSFRLSGLYLGLVTLGFGILLTEYAYTKTWFFGGEITTSGPHAWGFEGDKAFYYLLLVITILGLGLVVAIERSRLGRLLRGLSDSSLALSTLGTNVNVARFLVFCASAFLAGVSGGLYASLFGSVGEATYPYTQSLIVLTVLVISGRRTIFAAIVAPILLYVPPGYISSSTTQLWLQVAFGVAAVFVALNSQGAITRGVVSVGNSDQDSRDPATLRATPFHGRNAPVRRSGPIRRRAAGTSLTVGGTR